MIKSNNSGRRESMPPGGEEEKKMKMNKKLLGSLILGVMLCTPLTGARAADLTGGAIYGEGDSYSSDTSIVTKVETADGNAFTYDFHGDSQLTITDDTTGNPGSYGIYIIGGQNPDVKNITIANKLNINIIKEDSFGALSGINVSSVSDRTVDRSAGGNITIESDNDITGSIGATFEGVSLTAGNNNTISIGDSNITLKAIDAKYGLSLNGLYVDNGSGNLIKMGDGAINVTGTVASDSQNPTGPIMTNAVGMAALGENTIETGDVSVNINTTSDENTSWSLNYGITTTDGGTVNTNNGDITVHGTGGQEVYSYGIYAYDGNVEKTGGNIKAVAEGEGKLEARGVYAYKGTIKVGIADITAQTIGNGSVKDPIGLHAKSGGEIEYAGGTITAAADKDATGSWENTIAIKAENNSKIKVNEGTDNKVVINGKVSASGSGEVSLNINTADSVINGGIEAINNNSAINLNLVNGALWNATGYSKVSKLSINESDIYINTKSSIGTDIKIGEYSGTGNVYFRVDDINKDGTVRINTGAFVIDKATENSFIHVGAVNNSINTLDVGKTEEGLNALAKKVFYKGSDDGNLTGEVVLEEGLLTPEARGDLLFDPNSNSPGRGYVTNITGGNRTTETMYAMKNLAATAIVAWRQEDSTLSQRLGELRESTGGQGIWVRMSRGEFEYSGEYKNQYNFFQLGYDWAADNWHYGVAVSHNDGETAYTYGSGENRSTSLSLYGTWLGDAGHYADIVLKQGRLSNDFDVYTSAGHTSGDYDAWGTSLSGEYGRKFVLEDDWYITPQAQLTLMRIGGESYGTNNGIGVRQDTLYSAVGRLGFEVGKKVDDKGSVYAKASVLHDFAGNADTYLSYNGFTNSYSQDLSDTWFEAGIGFNYKISGSSYVYADVVRTFGGDVETPWQWNIGMRWSC